MSNKNAGWGILLITVGIQATLNQLMTLSTLVSAGILFVGGCVALALYFTNKTDWIMLVPVYILWALTGVAVYVEYGNTSGNIFPAVILFLVALPFLVVYFRNKENWWALIPAYVLLVVIPIVLFGDNRTVEDYIASYVLTAIAIPFLIVYFRNRKNWWALIPAYVMLVVAIIVQLAEGGVYEDDLLPAFVMLSIALPFFVVYFRNRSNWWALIPGGITGVIGLGLLFSTKAVEYISALAMIAGGLYLLLRKSKQIEA